MALRRAILVVAALFAALACAQDQGLLVPEAQVTYYICFLFSICVRGLDSHEFNAQRRR